MIHEIWSTKLSMTKSCTSTHLVLIDCSLWIIVSCVILSASFPYVYFMRWYSSRYRWGWPCIWLMSSSIFAWHCWWLSKILDGVSWWSKLITSASAVWCCVYATLELPNRSIIHMIAVCSILLFFFIVLYYIDRYQTNLIAISCVAISDLIKNRDLRWACQIENICSRIVVLNR